MLLLLLLEKCTKNTFLNFSPRSSRCLLLVPRPLHSSSRTPPPPPPPPPAASPLVAFVALLKSYSRTISTISDAELLHSRAIRTGIAQDDAAGTGLIILYARCGRPDLAHKLFDEIRQRDALSWTVLISGYSRTGAGELGLQLFSRMLSEGCSPNRFTLASIFRCCALGSSDGLGVGKSVHGWILRNGIELDVALHNSILDFYAKCGCFRCARNVFLTMREKDSISWNVMTSAYLRVGDMDASMELFEMSPARDASSWNTIINGLIGRGCWEKALQLLRRMVEIGPGLNQLTFSTALVLASKLALLKLGKQLHCQILRREYEYEHDMFVRNSLIDMYCKCGDVRTASSIFEGSSGHSHRSLAESISWSAMVAGYVHNGMDDDALELFCRMLREGFKVDQFVLTSIAAACSDAGIIEHGRQVHCFVEKLGYCFDDFMASAITDMYAKCGCLEDACKIFDNVCSRNVVLWTSMIGSYAIHGHGKKAIQVYEMMLKKNICPNEITFVHVLSACSHAGLVMEADSYFKSMKEIHGIDPSIEHFTCMVDLLGRAGLFEKAKDFIDENNINNYAVIWKSVLSACRVHNNIEMASWVSKQLFRLEPHDTENYVLLSNMYATGRRWKEASKLRSMMHERGIRKDPGKSWIQIKNKVHSFFAGDTSHPQIFEIYSYLDSLIGRLKEIGYCSQTELVVHDVEEEQKESALIYHSEKLAIAYGIISTPFGTTIRVMKNLRVCTDCHEAIKFISIVTGREVVLRDAHRFHHFKCGKCSCDDYW